MEQGVTGTATLSPAACAESGLGCMTEQCSCGWQRGILSPARQLGPGWESTSVAHLPAKPVLQSWLLSRPAVSQPKTLKNLLVPRRRLHTRQGVTAANSSKVLGIPVANRLVPGADRRAARETG